MTDEPTRVVVITGAAVGIGRATARSFGELGDRVYLLDIDATAGQEAAAGISNAVFITCDVTAPDDVTAAISSVSDLSDRIDVLVNNAGGFSTQRTIEDTPLEEWRSIIDLNLTSAFLMTRAALPLIRRSEAGRIINIGSLAGQLTSYRTSPPYAAAKAGLHGLTRVMASELAGDGITVNALAPSAVMTERITHLRDEAERRATADTIPLGRYQYPEEVASWIVHLASADAGFMTGQTISVNGGRFMV